MAGLVQVAEGFVVQPKDIINMYALPEDSEYNTRITFRNGGGNITTVSTSATVAQLVKALSGATRL